MQTTKILKGKIFLPITVLEMLIVRQVFLFVPLSSKFFHGKSTT